MRVITVEYKGITVEVRSKYRRTAVIKAQYMSYLRKKYPNIASYEAEVAAIPIPGVVPKDSYSTRMREYEAKTRVAASKHGDGFVLYDSATDCTTLLSRIVSIKGAPFSLGADGYFVFDHVVTAFEHYLDSEDQNENDEESLWIKIAMAIAELDAPVTSLVERPPQTLTPEEVADPKSVAAD